MEQTTDPVITAYYAARHRRLTRRHCGDRHYHRLRDAILNAEGSHCATCHSHERLRLAATTGAAWDAAVASKGHAAILQLTRHPRRVALYAAAAASPRVRAYCPRCIPAARIRRHLEALNAASHGPHSNRTL